MQFSERIEALSVERRGKLPFKREGYNPLLYTRLSLALFFETRKRGLKRNLSWAKAGTRYGGRESRRKGPKVRTVRPICGRLTRKCANYYSPHRDSNGCPKKI